MNKYTLITSKCLYKGNITWIHGSQNVTQLLSYALHACNVQVQAPQTEKESEKQIEVMTHHSETVENNDRKTD